ncbi:uncharacterized protein LOC107608945 isoform X3 [Arachis ipaensis]|nr:uncharacterized protein LOC107608945 isoform X3 [Arachis ipaensis]QHN90886.1 Disease resistance protein [Arachis hypogaea]
MDFVSSFAASISRDLVCGAVDELRYPCCFHDLVEGLEHEDKMLVDTKKRVQEHVHHQKRQLKKTDELMHKWLNQANNLSNDVDNLLTETRTNKIYCFGKCPNLFWRYRLGKKLVKNKGDVKKCIGEGSKYTQFERLASLPGLRYFSPERCLKFESTQSAYDQLMQALNDDTVNMVGMYGMPGCGKTTLAMEVGRKAKEEGLFGEVVFVPVSSVVEIQRIQEKIASWLQFDFPQKEEIQRAQCLDKFFGENHENVLLILDDVWDRLDFEAIGIPSFKNHRGCKVLITTRSEAVCSLNDCQKKIRLKTIELEEAWKLFQTQAQITEDTSNALKKLAKEISDKCEGLLVAIVAIANTLKGKGEADWKVASDNLKRCKPVIIEGGLQNPYKILRVSYDNLDPVEQSLFLLCSVFPEDFEIPVEDLIRIAIGVGLVEEVVTFEGARNKVIVAKDKLLSFSLLLDAVGVNCVKMHDLVRDVARWIARNDGKAIECVMENNANLVDSTPIRYLWCKQFPVELDCSSIEFLCIKTDTEVSEGIFKGIASLRVLILCWEGHQTRELSTMSLKSLTDLHSLFLSGWELFDISFVGDMKKLESLTLHNCSLPELIDVLVTQVPNLRLLNLSGCEMEGNPFEVIGKHPRIEELYINDDRPEWDLEDEDPPEFFSKFSVPQPLERYQIRLGKYFSKYQQKCLSHGRTLFLSCFDTSNVAVRNLAKKAEILHIANIRGDVKSIIPGIFQIEGGGGGMNHGWIELLIKKSEDIVHLVDTGKHLSEVGSLLSELRKLTIKRMKKLRYLYHGQHGSGLFVKLEELYIKKCPQLQGTLFDWKLNLCSLTALKLFECKKLTSVFTLAAARVSHLEILEILYCDGIKHVLDDDEEIESSNDDDGCLVFQKLKRLLVRGCKKIEYIIPATLAQGLLHLECLEIEDNNELKHVFGHSKHGAQKSQNALKIDLPRLGELALVKLPNIISICPRNCRATWQSLHQVALRNCPEFVIESANNCMAGSKRRQDDQSIIEDKTNGKMSGSESIWNNSEIEGNFHLDEVPINRQEMTSWYIWKGAKHFVTLQNVTLLYILGCQKLKVIFSPCVLRSLPQLTILVVIQCHELEQIIEEDENYEVAPNPESKKVSFSKLKLLLITHCNKLKHMFHLSASHEFPQLEYLIIKQNPCLEQVFRECEQDVGDRNGRVVEALLPELKHVILMQLPNLCNISQGIEFNSLDNLLVHNCPKLTLTSTTTAEEMLRSYYHDNVINFFVLSELLCINDIVNKETVQHQPASESRGRANESDEILTSGRENKGSRELQSLEQIPQADLTQREFVNASRLEDKEHKSENINKEGSSQNQYHERCESKNLEEKEISYGQEHEEPKREELNKKDFIEPRCSYVLDRQHQEKEHSCSVCITQCSNDTSIVEELNSLVEAGELRAECVATLSSFLTAQPSMRLTIDNSSLIFKGFAYSSLHRLVSFLSTQPLLSLVGDKHAEFLDLIRLVGCFPFNKGWLSDLEDRVATSLPVSSLSSLDKLLADKQQVLSKLEPLQDRVNALHSELAELSTEMEPLLRSLQETEAQEANILATLNYPLFQL